ncbi:MAG: hypothetical protein EHM41_16920, partial [Chloroflexi bacterium]
MRKRLFFSVIAVVFISVAVLAVSKPANVPIVAQLTHQDRPAAKMPTITTLPEFPGIPLYATLLSDGKKDELI